MDINGNFELDNFEKVINNVSEGVLEFSNGEDITEEMMKESIKKQINNNKDITTAVNLTMLDLIRGELLEYVNENVRDR